MNPTSKAYTALLHSTKLELQALRKKLRRISLGRMFLFILGTLALVYAMRSAVREVVLPELGGILAAVAYLGFLLLVRKHASLMVSRYRADARQSFLLSELKAMAGNDSDFEEGEAVKVEHPYAADLDLFGPDSLFRHVNRAATEPGRKRMREHMLTAPVNASELADWQDAVKSIASSHESRVHFLSTASQLKNETAWDSLTDWTGAEDEGAGLAGSSVRTLLFLAPVFSVLILLLYAMGWIPESLMLLLFLLPLVLSMAFFRRSSAVYDKVGRQAAFLKKLGAFFAAAEALPMQSPKVSAAVNRLQDAQRASTELGKIVASFDQRNNLLAAIITNALYLSDLRNARKAIHWRMAYGARFAEWVEAAAELEVLSSLATFAANHGDALSYPASAESGCLEAHGMVHPLMLRDTPVANDFKLDDSTRIVLVTGANMAGKSTFLRALGMNVLLARMGAPVAARSFSMGDFVLFTAMRTSDDLAAGTSYFMAELKRLAALIDLGSKSEMPVLALLDEILKGTNSADKEAGSRAFVEQLYAKGIRTLVATHDVSLCSLADEYPEIKNSYFAADIRANDLYFDYQLRPGVCDTMNATFLMKKMGIVKA